MSLIRTAIAALLYAALMTGWSAYEGEPFRGAYLLGFTFYAITFGVLFHIVMWVIERRKAPKP